MRSNSASELCTSTPDGQQRLDREEQPRLQRREGDQRADRDRVRAARDALPANQYTSAGMIAKLIWTEAIRQRPAMRERTSRSASASDSRAKRSASSGERPIVLPSRMPDTDSDSSTSDEMSAMRPWRVAAMRLRSWPTRRVSQTKNGSSASEKTARRQSSATIATSGGDHGRHVGDDRGRGGRHHVLHAADVVGDARLHLARARAREEGERQALEVAVDGRAQVVHDALADDVGDPRLRDAERAGGDRDPDHAEHQPGQERRVAVRDRGVEDLAQQERRDHPEAGREQDEREDRAEAGAVGPEQARDPAHLRLAVLLHDLRTISGPSTRPTPRTRGGQAGVGSLPSAASVSRSPCSSERGA